MNLPGPILQPMIECAALTRTYDLGAERVHALRDVTFTVNRGEFVAIMGPSGSGKSTLLNLLGALDRPTSGDLVVDGQSVARMSGDDLARLRNREIGFVFQQFNLLPRMSALENVMLPLTYSPLRGLDRPAIARARLEEIGLGARIHHRPNQLSGGQQQRVAIARALANSPNIILADEPTGALDTHMTAEIMALFSRLHQKGLTVVVITHEPEVAAYAERLLTFRDGELVKDVCQAPIAVNGA
ncbi:ABC transporter ATP-binding protein [Methylocapsa palsarum]|uniref:Putative ABC transport system ATP-binding protein n=1 Tax=Methylocapsa palsarum TaxID=1612308 RepID=A0A1I4BMS3_9HYPH|nr:ABC transporter ATP-binding protein [Methylocapsa palsarum]SFK69276.1 putative ABC transport system ATP-binding protein [Methylocapsa palsarum]